MKPRSSSDTLPSIRSPFLSGLVLLGLSACVLSGRLMAQMPGDAVPEAAMQKSEAAMTEFSQALRSKLTDTLARDGAVAAIDVCAKEAPALAATVGAKHGVRIGRTGARPRNPANMPDHWQRGALERFSMGVAQGRRPETLSHRALELGRAQFARGIAMEETCLACHGPRESMASGVAEELAKRYPMDQGSGFALGELYGLLWVELDVVSIPASDAP